MLFKSARGKGANAALFCYFRQSMSSAKTATDVGDKYLTRSLILIMQGSITVYNLIEDKLEKHGTKIVTPPRSFEGLKKYLEENYIEGIVFWKDGEPKCKIRRKDYGFPWNRE